MSKLTERFRWLNWNVIATVLITKFLVLMFGAQAFQVLKDMPLEGSNSFYGIWRHWDALNYLKIAENGYTAAGDDRFLIVFFPLYPLLVSITSVVTRDYLLAGFLVTAVASLAAGLVFRELVKLDHSERIAQSAVLFMFIFPTSYFLHIPYTESLFLALVIGCFLAARKRLWFTVAILGALACMTRVNGLVLVFALAFEVWEEYRETRKFNTDWLFLAVVPAGFGFYLLLNYLIAGNPTMFMVYQNEHWHRYFRVPWEGLWEAWKRIFNPKVVDAQMNGVQEVLFVVIGLVATIVGWRSMRNSYRAWMLVNWLIFVSTSFVLSVPRYTLTLFPLFISMALLARRTWSLNVLFICWSVLYLALFIARFVSGVWAF